MAEFRLLQDRDKEQASALWQECFGDSDGFCRWFMSEQWNGEYSVAAVEEGKLVSMIHGRPYTLWIRGRGVPCRHNVRRSHRAGIPAQGPYAALHGAF